MIQFLSLLFLVAILFPPQQSPAQIEGKSQARMDLQRASGNVRLNFAIIGELVISDSKLDSFDGYELKVRALRVDGLEVTKMDLSGAKLQKSNWRKSTLRKWTCRGCDLRQAEFHSVEVSNCTLDRADLRGAQMNDVAFSNCSYWGAQYDNNTRLPFDPAAEAERGMIYVP